MEADPFASISESKGGGMFPPQSGQSAPMYEAARSDGSDPGRQEIVFPSVPSHGSESLAQRMDGLSLGFDFSSDAGAVRREPARVAPEREPYAYAAPRSAERPAQRPSYPLVDAPAAPADRAELKQYLPSSQVIEAVGELRSQMAEMTQTIAKAMERIERRMGDLEESTQRGLSVLNNNVGTLQTQQQHTNDRLGVIEQRIQTLSAAVDQSRQQPQRQDVQESNYQSNYRQESNYEVQARAPVVKTPIASETVAMNDEMLAKQLQAQFNAEAEEEMQRQQEEAHRRERRKKKEEKKERKEREEKERRRRAEESQDKSLWSRILTGLGADVPDAAAARKPPQTQPQPQMIQPQTPQMSSPQMSSPQMMQPQYNPQHYATVPAQTAAASEPQHGYVTMGYPGMPSGRPVPPQALYQQHVQPHDQSYYTMPQPPQSSGSSNHVAPNPYYPYGQQ